MFHFFVRDLRSIVVVVDREVKGGMPCACVSNAKSGIFKHKIQTQARMGGLEFLHVGRYCGDKRLLKFS